MVHRLSDPFAGPRRLTQSVLQITELLGMYQAELARVLGAQCGDVGELASGKRALEPGSRAWEQAVLFVRFYEALYEAMQGDGVSMRNWLRRENPELGGVPLMLIVDEGRLSEVLDFVENHALQ